jgi:hypothetical protein
MIIDLKLTLNKKGDITNKIADYQPDDRVKERTGQVLKDFLDADTIRNKPYEEFNQISLAQRMNLDQMSYNQFTTAVSNDPADAWRSRAFRPIVRNKVMTIASHVGASVIYPKIFAQNNDDMEDRDAAMVMRDIMEWSFEQSHYDEKFIQTVIAALVNPCAFVHTEYAEHYRKVKEIKADGTWEEKEVIDDIYSGFQDTVVPCDEIWIGDIYENSLQKQPYLIWRRVIDYSIAKAKYGDNENFKKYVTPGVQFLYSDVQNLFYEVYDQSQQGRLVEEVIYYNRQADLQLVFVNGVLLTDVDQPNPRKDKLYPFTKTGYEYIDEGRFFYYKSLPFKLSPDEEVINTLYRMVIDGTYLNVMPPAVVFGNEEITSSVIAPGLVTTINNADAPNASFQTLGTNNNLNAGMNMLQKVESSVNESSSDVLQSGQPTTGDQTAFEISRLEQNARIMLGMFAKMVGNLVKDWGTLRSGDILQFITVGQVAKIEDPVGRLKFNSFVLPNKDVEGKQKTRRIQFDANLPEEGTELDLMMLQEKMVKEEDKTDMQLIKVNPKLFRELQFKCYVVPEAVLPKSDALKKALQLEEYALAIQNPITNKESVTRDLLFGSFEATMRDPDKYMMKPQQNDLTGKIAAGLRGQVDKTQSTLAESEGVENVQELVGAL